MRCFSSILILLSSLYIVISCPNDCNKNGLCNKKDECECFAPYAGYDCSFRSCPSGLSWDGNHTMYVECSNRGICDRELGICRCLYGYVGQSCERIHCLAVGEKAVCNDHGRCLSMRNYHKKYIDLSIITTDSKSFSLKDIQLSYTNWDADRIFGCVCDPGFKGPSCTIRECPYGVVAGRDKWDSTSFIKLTDADKFSDLELLIINCKEEDDVYCRYEIFKLISYMTRNDIRDMIKQNGVVRDVKIYFYEYTGDNGDNTKYNRVEDLKGNDILVVRFVVDPYARVLGYRKKGDTDGKFTLIKITEKTQDKINTNEYYPTYTSPDSLKDVPYLKFSVCADSSNPSSCYVEAHSDKVYMECSGLGECDSKNGVCKCIQSASPSNKNQGYIGDNYEYNYDYTKNINNYNKENFVYNCRLKGKEGYNNIKIEINNNKCKKGVKNVIKHDNDHDFTQYPYCDCNKNGEDICDESSSSIFSINHKPEICGGLGTCAHGECNCIPGYVGATCSEFDSPHKEYGDKECNEHGIVVKNDFNEWEVNNSAISYCKCNVGYDGPTCADKLCSYGPETTDSTTIYPSIEFKCTTTNKEVIIEYNPFRGKQTINSNYKVSDFTTALMAVGVNKPFIFYKDNTKISSDDSTSLCDSSQTIKIEFPYYCGTELNGGPSSYNGIPSGGYELTISGSSITDPPIKAIEGSKCYVCSNHGICNQQTGNCECDRSYTNYIYKEGGKIFAKNNCQIPKRY